MSFPEGKRNKRRPLDDEFSLGDLELLDIDIII